MNHHDESQQKLADKHILISNAASDIGYHLALACAHQGAHLLLLTKRRKPLYPLYDTIIESHAPEPWIVEFDVNQATPEHFNALTQHLSETIPALDGLVHTAIKAHPVAPFANSTRVQFERAYLDHFMIPAHLTHACLPLLKRSADSRVIFTALDVGLMPRANWSALGSAYAALENLIQTLALEHPNIHFNSIDISHLKTSVRRKFYPAEIDNPKLIHPDDPVFLNRLIDLLSKSAPN